jgi:hypothetical protein
MKLVAGRIAPVVQAKTIACATRSIPDWCPASPASDADAPRRTHIIFALHSPARSGERSATNTRSPSVARIIANCMAMATRLHGGPESTSIPFRSRSRYGNGLGRTGSWNQRPERCRRRRRGKPSSLVQSGQAIDRPNHERETERSRTISFRSRRFLKAY